MRARCFLDSGIINFSLPGCFQNDPAVILDQTGAPFMGLDSPNLDFLQALSSRAAAGRFDSVSQKSSFLPDRCLKLG